MRELTDKFNDTFCYENLLTILLLFNVMRTY
jgi:hypothetical protein